MKDPNQRRWEPLNDPVTFLIGVLSAGVFTLLIGLTDEMNPGRLFTLSENAWLFLLLTMLVCVSGLLSWKGMCCWLAGFVLSDYPWIQLWIQQGWMFSPQPWTVLEHWQHVSPFYIIFAAILAGSKIGFLGLSRLKSWMVFKGYLWNREQLAAFSSVLIQDKNDCPSRSSHSR